MGQAMLILANPPLPLASSSIYNSPTGKTPLVLQPDVGDADLTRRNCQIEITNNN